MCRFLYYQGAAIHLSELLTEPEHSLIHQSFHSHERDEPLNGDGFGVAWFVAGDRMPAVFRSVSPAWSNGNLIDLARVTQSSRVMAHVRAATQGTGVAEANCHPFRMRGLTFMHNGDLGDFASYRRPLLEGLSDAAFGSIQGSADSEHLLARISDEWVGLPQDGDPAERLARALEAALREVLRLWRSAGSPDHLYVNCALTDGEAAVACRFTTDAPEYADTLYLHQGMRYACVDGASVLAPCPEGRTSVLVSSEPLTPGEEWHAIPVGQVVLVGVDQEIRRRPLEAL